MQHTTVFFLHLPKTAGTTMRRLLDRVYRDARRYEIGEDINGDIRAFRARGWEAGNAPHLVQGHMSYGLHRFVPGPATYLTLMRDPIRRSLSDYHYVTSTPGHPIHEHVKDMTLVEYLNSGITGQLSNGQVRLLSGDHYPDDPGVPSNRPMERADLQRAHENLQDNFTAVGLQEYFDETLILFRRQLGWRWPFYQRVNVTRRPYRLEDIDPVDLMHIRALNELDMELFESVRKRMERDVEAAGSAFRRELSAFRMFNRAWGALVRAIPPAVWQARARLRNRVRSRPV